MKPRKRKPRTTDKTQSRDFGGYGKLRCRICGEPYTKHEGIEFCPGKKKEET